MPAYITCLGPFGFELRSAWLRHLGLAQLPQPPAHPPPSSCAACCIGQRRTPAFAASLAAAAAQCSAAAACIARGLRSIRGSFWHAWPRRSQPRRDASSAAMFAVWAATASLGRLGIRFGLRGRRARPPWPPWPPSFQRPSAAAANLGRGQIRRIIRSGCHATARGEPDGEQRREAGRRQGPDYSRHFEVS